MKKELLSIRQMADMTGLQRATFHCRKSAGELNLGWVKIGRSVFATQDSFLAWIREKAAKRASEAARLNAIITELEGGK